MASIKDLKRMCDTYKDCHECPLNDTCGGDSVSALPDNADEIIDKWVSEHPIKTYLQDFFEKFPNARRNSEGVPEVCPQPIYPELANECLNNCFDCWTQEMKEEK